MLRLLILSVILVPIPAPGAVQPELLDNAFDRLYRLDFSGAQTNITEFIRKNPGDPVGYAIRSAAYLFYELDRLSILESEFFGNDKRITEKKEVKPDEKIKTELLEAIAKARSLSGNNPNDKNALFALCIAAGIQTDYMALIEKRQLGSLTYAKESHKYAVKLLGMDPGFYDAYLTTGLSEYLLGSVPFFVRWFIKFDQAQGSKSIAVRNLELVSKQGRYFRPFAKVLLAIVHLREKRPVEAEKLLAELTRQYPENPLFKKELDKLVNRSRIER